MYKKNISKTANAANSTDFFLKLTYITKSSWMIEFCLFFFCNFPNNDSYLGRFIAPKPPCILNFKKVVGAVFEIRYQ